MDMKGLSILFLIVIIGIITVAGFLGYKYLIPPKECGNNICNTGEDCSNCPSDCGQCHKVIAFDDSHGNPGHDMEYADLIGMLKSEEFDVKLIGEGLGSEDYRDLTNEDLQNVDILVVGEVHQDYSDKEISLIKNYVEKGGKLIAIVPSIRWYTKGDFLAIKGVEHLVEEFGGVNLLNNKESNEFWLSLTSKNFTAGTRGEVEVEGHPITSGIKNLYVWDGPMLNVSNGRIIGRNKDTVLQLGTEHYSVDIPQIVELYSGNGKIILLPDVFVRSEQTSSFGIDGAGFKMFANTVSYLINGTSSSKTQSYYTKYFRGVDKKIKTNYNILFVPVDFDKNFTVEDIAKLFKEKIEGQFNVIINYKIVSEISTQEKNTVKWEEIKDAGVYSAPSYKEGGARWFYLDVVDYLKDKENLDNFDLVVIISGDYGFAFGCGEETVSGMYLDGEYPENPFGVVLYGKQVRIANLTNTEMGWKYDKIEPLMDYNLNQMTHTLMHEFGHHLGFPDYMVAAPCIMSGFIENPTLVFCDFEKNIISYNLEMKT